MGFSIIFYNYRLFSILVNDKQIAIIMHIAVDSSMDSIKVDFHFASMTSVVLAWQPFLTFMEACFHLAFLASCSR